MKPRKRDDHFYPQAVLRQWSCGTEQIVQSYVRNGAPIVEKIRCTNSSKIMLFSKPYHDQFFSFETMRSDDLDKFRRKFENSVKDKAKKILKRAHIKRSEIESDYMSLSMDYSPDEKKFWLQYYFLCVLLNPITLRPFENWYRLLIQSHDPILYQCIQNKNLANLPIAPNLLVNGKMLNRVLKFGDIFISFYISKEENDFFLASDSYMPYRFFRNFSTFDRIQLIPLHPSILLRAFYQTGAEVKETKKLQLRVFFEETTTFNNAAIKYGTQIIGTPSQFEYMESQKQKLLIDKTQ